MDYDHRSVVGHQGRQLQSVAGADPQRFRHQGIVPRNLSEADSLGEPISAGFAETVEDAGLEEGIRQRCTDYLLHPASP